jgi:hypothetical protein
MKAFNSILLIGMLACLLSCSHADDPSTTTQTPSSTTTTKAPAVVLNFTVPNGQNVSACLRAQFSLTLLIKYTGVENNKTSNLTVQYPVTAISGYDGDCNSTFNTLKINLVPTDWTILFNYTLVNEIYQLDRLRFEYTIDSNLFPNANETGKHVVVEQSNLNDFSANKGSSYKCTSQTSIELNDTVTFNFSNYQAQPFSGQDKKDFDTAIECAADLTGTSKLVPIIVGSSLAVLVVLVLVAYIIGRRKHRPGYQQV